MGVKVARWVSFTWNEASLDDVFVRPPTIIELGREGLSCEKEAEREGHGNGCPRAEIKWMSSGKWYMNRLGAGGQGVMYRYIFIAGSCALHKPAALRGGGQGFTCRNVNMH